MAQKRARRRLKLLKKLPCKDCLRLINLRACGYCGETRPLNLFVVSKGFYTYKCKDCRNTQERQRYADNPWVQDYYQAYSRDWNAYPDNRERANAYKRQRFAENPELREQQNARSRHRDHVRRSGQKGGSFPPSWKETKRFKQANLCGICQTALDGEEHEHHVIPLSKGGKDEPDNIVLTHAKCNISIGNRLPVKYIPEKGIVIYENRVMRS